MSSLASDEAVVLYRDLAKLDRKRCSMEKELAARVERLSEDDFEDYMKKTRDIDQAIDEAEGRELSEQASRELLNAAGRS